MQCASHRVLITIYQFDPDRRRSLSITAIATRSGLSEKAVRNNVKRLKAAGLIRLQRAHAGVPYTFEILEQGHEQLIKASGG